MSSLLLPIIAARHRSTAWTWATWSTTNHATDVSLADADISAVCTGTDTGGLCLSSTSKTTGKFYAEFLCVNALNSSTGASTPAFGLHLSPFTLANYLGQASTGFGSWAQGSTGWDRNTYNNGFSANAGTPVPNARATGQYGRLAVDVGAGKLWLTWWGATAWLGGGDPATGTSPTYTFTGGSTTYFACCPRVSSAKIKIVRPGSWQNAAPSGFGAWT